MPSDTRPKRQSLVAASIAALVSLLPFARMLLDGQSFYFRDLAGQFFPARRFLLEGLSRGEWRFWNPLVHEGVPLALSPFGYLPDLLQLLIPSEFGISLFLALHIPLAAFSFALLARDFEVSPAAAVTGGVIYALGGFSLSTINLYVYAQTLGWAPLFVLAFRRSVESGTTRAIALAGLCLAVTISTTGLEIALQTCVLAVVIAPPVDRARFARSAASASLGLALSASVVIPLMSLTGDSERGTGFATSVVLANSVHPLAFIQVLVAGFFGDTSNLTGSWWGVNFFPRGFPYMLSLYLGPAALALAAAGAASGRRSARRLVVLGGFAALLCLGRYAGWESFFDISPALRFLRFPVKAFFTVQFSIALLAAFAVDRISDGAARHLRRVASLALALGGALVASMLLPSLAPNPTAWFLKGFLPESVGAAQRALVAQFITGDAAASGFVALTVGVLCLMVDRGRLPASWAASGVAALIAADLLRAGAGLNPSVTSEFYTLSPEMAREVKAIREQDGRVFTCDPQASASYWAGRRARGDHHEAFTMAAMQETLTPDFNMPFGVRTALSIDRTMLVPTDRVMSPELKTCRDFETIAPSLRAAGVTRVLSLEPLTSSGLILISEVAPARIAPLKIRVYRLDLAAPRFSAPVKILADTPNLIRLAVSAERPMDLTILEPFDRGWRATTNGVDAPIHRTEEGHREISLPQGQSEVVMSYEPLGLRTGLAITVTAVLVCLGLLVAGSGPVAFLLKPVPSPRIEGP